MNAELPQPPEPAAAADSTAADPTAQFVAWVRGAAPYIHAFRGKTFVIAFGGEVASGDSAQRLAYDCNLLAALGIRLVLVHGARPQIDAELLRRGLEPRFHNGLRVTDAQALECVKAAMAVTRIEVEALLSQGLPNTPMAGSYMRVTGGNFITARPVGVVDGVDYQYTGAVRKIVADEINADLDQQNVVLISPLGVSPAGEIFNLCMEEVAETVAVALKAEKLIYLCDAPGLLDADGKLIDSVTADEAERMLEAGEGLTEDLHLFLPCALRAVRRGVARAHLIDRDKDGGLLLEFFTHAGVGTVVSRAPLFRLREATVEDVGALVALISPMEADGTLVRRGRELLEQEIERFTVVEHDGVLVGCAALYPFSEDNAAELACLAVTPEYRRAGLGDQLLRRIERRARAQRLERLFVLTTRTAHWFRERGFSEIGPEALPRQKRELYNYQRRSKVFVKNL
ncbi:amino-acid N-acetyltransferase [Pseudothauera rhizosphaerae]|uniref:Amino-acid acetyltransferase n=1 Tax=Pseudothauera rhizosphaerae TaxID=2565932 RepID=A0A4S4AM72_9RHOO|nr:amino-acid N-acetyltransferase [Pseudothauera rhizosphaerae]THF60679.1 amino-acid N-acetyltransferase [Pseudothauera rhizosphaerae]